MAVVGKPPSRSSRRSPRQDRSRSNPKQFAPRERLRSMPYRCAYRNDSPEVARLCGLVRSRITEVANHEKRKPPRKQAFPRRLKRRGWDLNPRGTYAPAGFQDRCNRPLCHLSEGFHCKQLRHFTLPAARRWLACRLYRPPRMTREPRVY